MTIYIADTHLLTPLGDNTLKTFYAYQAGCSAYRVANYHTSDHQLVTLSLVPDGVLPPLADVIAESEILSSRDERILQMTHFTLGALLSRHSGETIPMILAGPENYSTLTNQLPPKFLQLLKIQTGFPLHYEVCRTLSMGRAGVLEALKLAQGYLDSGYCEKIIVGGVDSCQHSEWLAVLDKDGRIKSESERGNADSFVPGEGAAFLMLTNNPDLAYEQNGHRFILSAPGLAEEPGHLYSSQPYLGSGLDKAVKG
ncbi:MAG: beta-ketoacyl synthase N-terminal-like domain-containing protein, partial [Cellvibrio sp.]